MLLHSSESAFLRATKRKPAKLRLLAPFGPTRVAEELAARRGVAKQSVRAIMPMASRFD
jgi:hypothetical protein